MNKAIVAGLVIEEPRIKITHSGFQVLEFPVVTSEDYTDKQGAHKTRNIRHNIVAYGKLAEKNQSLVLKDCYVLVDGSVQNEFLDKPEGGKGFRSEIVAKNIYVPAIRKPR